jgi:TBC1 domain family protein 5
VEVQQLVVAFAEIVQSPWNTLRQDEEMRAEIFQDVERCMPEEPYFRKPHTQRIMLDILFIFCKINQDVGYRQGMHELLAPILWVVEQDAIDYGNDGDPHSGSKEDSLLKQILDPTYIENDTFTLFSLIMRAGSKIKHPVKRYCYSTAWRLSNCGKE